MKNAATIFKWAVIGFIVIAILWMFKQCHHHEASIAPKEKRDTVWKTATDTVKVSYQTLVPYKIIYHDSTLVHDTLETFELQKVDSARILQQYFAERYYSRSYPVQYGSATINDTVTQNRIIGRSIIFDQSLPEITRTVTLTQPKRNVLLVGVTAIGSQFNYLYAPGVTLDLKLKTDAMIGVGALVSKDQGIIGQLSFKFPIRFRKQ